MQKYKFLNLLDTFSDREFKLFGKFLYSPFFNESRKLIELYDFLKKYFNSHSFDKLTLELISENIFREEKYNSVKTRKLVSDFTFQLENFLVHISVDRNKVEKKTLLAGEYKKKLPGKYLESEINYLKKNLFKSSENCKDFYFSKLKLAEDELTTKKNSLHRNLQIENIKDYFVSINKINTFEKLYIYHILIQNNIQDDDELIEHGFDSLNGFLKEIEINKNCTDMSDCGIQLYYMILQLIASKRIDIIYEKAENFINDMDIFLKKADIEFISYTIITFIINEINRGRYDNISFLIEILKKIDKKGHLNNIVEINHITFVEIVHFAVLLKDIAFAESFIWKYFSKINSYYKIDSLNLAIAVLRYGQNRFGDVRQQLEKLKYKSYGFYLIANSLLLKIYYEENSLKYIFPLVDSFKHFLKRNKTIPNYFRESFSVFLGYLIKLTSIKAGKMKDIFRIENKISEEKNFYGKEWIEEKLRILNSEI